MICKFNNASEDVCFYRDSSSGLCAFPGEECKHDTPLDYRTEKLLAEMKECKGYVSVSDLAERFEEVDLYFNRQEWNLRQILSNIDIYVPKYFNE